ncbi:MAG TPA: exodeoxyribonuclease VII small subunit [Kiloniellales bacterium]
MARKEGRPDIAKMSFEDALEELKEIVSALESGEGRLDEAIEAYERGALLKKHCETKLREAQEKIEKISLGAGGQVKTDAFDAG